ncbi:hypothetical protein N431DRAFT_343717 [Stipitochalara longipes BDJ]|nr:hypothetical protein N431DRAFT_343717 [Stipitochalara longipes BDJ]
MSAAPRNKSPLDVLQSMINGILIETGKALRSSNKEGGKTLANAKSRLSSTIPSAIENFHLALDELECDILRAKSVLLRDLEGLRAKRYALENPVPIVEEVESVPEQELNGDSTMADTTEQSTIKEEVMHSESPEKQASNEIGVPSSTQDPAKEDIAKIEEVKEQQALTPPPSNDAASQPIGLGINTEGAADSDAPGTAEPQNSAIDSLFDIPDNENTGDSELNFEHMDFSLHDSNQDPSQTQAHEFDLSTFGSTTQDFNMNTMQTDSNITNNPNNVNKEVDDLFGDLGNAGDNMDLDLDLEFGTAGAEDSLFNDMFIGEDDGGFGGGGEMEHGDFDNDFFGINNND